MQAVINKYSRASLVLSGIGVNPDAHTDTGYAPFNDTPIRQYFQNSSVISVADVNNPNAEAGPIIGLPQTNYTNLHILGMKDYIESGMDVSYYGALQFGTPAQELTVSVDTGSADLWIPTNCPSCSNAQFTPGDSSTFHDSKKRVSLVYVRTLFSVVSSKKLMTFSDLRAQEESLGPSLKMWSRWAHCQ